MRARVPDPSAPPPLTPARRYKLTASGVGGCGGANQPLAPGAEDSSGCYCSWGTVRAHPSDFGRGAI